MNKILSLSHISKTFIQGGKSLTILKDINLEIHQGEVIALVGPSGCGKSTLLYIAGLLEKPTKGDIFIDGKKIHQKSDLSRTILRRQKMGFIYQSHLLLNDFTALENVMMPLRINGMSKKEALEKGVRILSELGLGKRINHRPGQMSGGEGQRVAIARALIHQPDLLLADEPTGNLDPKTSDEVFDILLKMARQNGLTALIATHNLDLAQKMDRILKLEDGVLIEK